MALTCYRLVNEVEFSFIINKRLLVSVCQYIDVFSTYSTIIAIPVIGKDVGLESSTQTWIIDGYLLVFASFLLFFGKTSDIYSPKLVFVIGLFWLGLMHLIAGFMSNAIALIIIKAISGLGKILNSKV